jgi:hypothetical protein
VPFCPQLVALEGDMIVEWLGGDPQRCGWSPDRDRRRPLAWDELLDELAAQPPRHGIVKLQVTGPVTLACALERRGGSSSRRSVLALAGEVAQWLAANAATWSADLAARGLPALLVVDEPALAAFGTRGTERAWDPLRGVAAAWGLHVCCAVPWELVGRAAPDVLSFDLCRAPLDERATRALRALLARGTRIAWGAVDGHRPEGLHDVVARLDDALARTGARGEQSLLTPSCGTGRVSPRREEEIAVTLSAAATRLRRASSSIHSA